MQNRIWGREHLLASLRRAMEQDRVSHAYLFVGAKGAGKRMLADAFAKALQCRQGGTEPCGECDSCRAMQAHQHPDCIYVQGEKKTLGVEEIRAQIGETVYLKQYRYRYKIYIIPEADTMTVQAQNALLKTLEEPPKQVIFLLLAENERAFLPTILSRTVVMKLPPLPQQTVERYLMEEKDFSPQEAALYGSYAQGSIGKALELSESETFSQMRQEILAFLMRLPQMAKAEVLEYAKELEKYKSDTRFLEMIYLWYRDVLTVKLLRQPTYLIQKDKQEEIFAAAAQQSAADAARKAKAVRAAGQALAQNGNFRLSMEVMLMALKENQSL